MPLADRRDTLLRQLSQHIPSDDAETQALRRIHEFVESRTDWDARHPEAHLTASAFILSAQRSHLLLRFHRRLQRWLQPGGHLEAGEDPLGAARREAQEETGLRSLLLLQPAPLDLDVHLIPARQHEAAHAHLDVRFGFLSQGPDELISTAEDGASALRWVTWSDLRRYDLDPGILRASEKLGAYR